MYFSTPLQLDCLPADTIEDDISTKDLDDIKEWISGSLKGIEMNDGKVQDGGRWTARHQGGA